jgi:hypothetical protein
VEPSFVFISWLSHAVASALIICRSEGQ